MAIEMGASVRDVVESIHPHPTFSETLGAAAEIYFGTATDIYKPRKAVGRKDEKLAVSQIEKPTDCNPWAYISWLTIHDSMTCNPNSRTVYSL